MQIILPLYSGSKVCKDMDDKTIKSYSESYSLSLGTQGFPNTLT